MSAPYTFYPALHAHATPPPLQILDRTMVPPQRPRTVRKCEGTRVTAATSLVLNFAEITQFVRNVPYEMHTGTCHSVDFTVLPQLKTSYNIIVLSNINEKTGVNEPHDV